MRTDLIPTSELSRMDPARLLALSVAVLVLALGALGLGALGLGVLTAGAARAQDQGDLVVERFDAALDVAQDGTVRVVEDISVDFGDVEHHGIERAIGVRTVLAEDDTQVDLPEDREPADYHRVIELEDVEVSASAPDQLEVTRDGGVVVLRIGDPDETVTGRHDYEIAYTVHGALNAFEDRAELTWDVTGFGWDSPILETTATVRAPGIVDAACYRGPEGSTTPCAQARVDGDEARFAADRLDPGENLTISVGFPPEAVRVPPPLVEERWRLPRALTGDPLAVPLTAATSLLGIAAVVLGNRRWIPPSRSADAAGMRGEPPRGLAPAHLRLLVHERADDTALAATVFDLASRGHLDIEYLEGGDGDEAEGYRVRRRAGSGNGLADFEQALLTRLFSQHEVVEPGQLREELGEELPDFRERVEEQAVERGWYTERPSRQRGREKAVQGILLVGAAVLVGLALAFTTVALAAVPLAVAAVVLAILVQRRTARTREGQRLAEEARGFREYLTAGTAAGPQRAREDEFGTYLPHALALDAVPGWVGRFRTSAAPVDRWAPTYFVYPYAAGFTNADTLTSGVQSFSGHVGTAASASTSGGGGHSGGGFGGGGGGGW